MSCSSNDLSELIKLAEQAGIHANAATFKILLELLSLQVPPQDLYVLLRRISPLPQQQRKAPQPKQRET